jgi:acetyl esterase/lipase
MSPTISRDVVFSRPSGFRPLTLDLYVPDGASTLCVYLHGGGWRLGSRTDGPGAARSWDPSFFETVAGLGLAIASVDYRLSAEAVYPAQLSDVRAAIEFLAGLDLPVRRTVAWGVSAGGHLAALAALESVAAPESLGAREPLGALDSLGAPEPLAALESVEPVRERSRVAAVACWYPPTDLDALSEDIDDAGGKGDRGAESREGQLIGAALDERRDAVVAASPVSHARPGAPPFLFLHGDADLAVPPRQSNRLAEALAVHGGQCTVELIAGGTHMFPELDDAATYAIVERTVSFLLDPHQRG